MKPGHRLRGEGRQRSSSWTSSPAASCSAAGITRACTRPSRPRRAWRWPTGVQDPGHHHLPELLPPVRQALRHDGHRHDRGGGVRHHLRAGHRGDPHQQAPGPDGPPRRGLQDRGGQVPRHCQQIEECHEKGQPVLVGTISIEKSEHLAEMLKRGHQAQRAQRQEPREGGRDRRPGR